jgi:hypothetical protein
VLLLKANEVIQMLETGEYLLEHSIDDKNDEIKIVGHISKKDQNDNALGGLDRYEFAFREKSEQEIFYNGYTQYLKSKIG